MKSIMSRTRLLSGAAIIISGLSFAVQAVNMAMRVRTLEPAFPVAIAFACAAVAVSAAGGFVLGRAREAADEVPLPQVGDPIEGDRSAG
ncbi:hypothetical protein ACI2TD_18045 [Ralstonia nicotianae]